MIRTALALLALAVLVAPASAVTITFTHAGTASGNLAGIAFTDAAITITAVGDTANRTSFSAGYFIDHDSAQVAIAGVGTFSFVTGTRTFYNDLATVAGFSRDGAGGDDLLNGPISAALSGWDMTTSIGPVAGTVGFLQWGVSPVLTSGGVLLLNSNAGAGYFKAEVGGTVPDSGSTWLLFITAVVALGGIRRRLRA